MPQHSKSENINNYFFDGYYKEVWRHIFPQKTTLAETDFIFHEADLNSASSVLDIMCGYGRHSIELARRGVQVSAIDNLPDYISEIREKSVAEHLAIDCICADVLEMQIEKKFDAVICMGNSLQFFNEEDTVRLLANISDHLRPGGKFFINTWSLAEIAVKNIKEKSWSRIEDLLLISDCQILFYPTRMEIKSIIIKDSGEREEKTGIDFIFSINEMEAMLNKVGLKLNVIYSIPGKKVFTIGEPRAYIVAEKFRS